MKIKSEKGYIILALNNDQDDYVYCARVLARSIKKTGSTLPICLVSDKNYDFVEFDHTVTFPFGDTSKDAQWKLHNDWQLFYASPYRQSIKLEADMIVPRNIDHWFDVLVNHDVCVTLGARNQFNQLSNERFYRKIFDANALPDVYNAVTYWRRCEGAKIFFDTVREIFENWPHAMNAIKFGMDQPVNTDLAYAIALQYLGVEHYTSKTSVPSMIHMKPRILGIQGEDWTKEMVWEIQSDSFRIDTVEQLWPIHYNVKKFAQKIGEHYDKQ